jgi:hypothetical protein
LKDAESHVHLFFRAFFSGETGGLIELGKSAVFGGGETVLLLVILEQELVHAMIQGIVDEVYDGGSIGITIFVGLTAEAA